MQQTKLKTFVMKTTEFGFDMFIADKEKSNGCPVTEIIAEAEIWDERDLGKIEYWKLLTGYSELVWHQLTNTANQSTNRFE